MRRVILIGGAAVLILALGVAGYLVGQDRAPTTTEAAEERGEAHAQALERAREDSAEASRERGMRDGFKRGEAEGRRAGARRGEADGQAEASAELAAIEAQEAAEAEAASSDGQSTFICPSTGQPAEIAGDGDAICSGERPVPSGNPDASRAEVCADPRLAPAGDC